MVETEEGIDFITRALKAGNHLTEINHFLLHEVALEGLNRAVTLFDLSSRDYRKEHFPLFRVLTHVFANPLCQTIFDARLRCFSDYYVPLEPLNSLHADFIINQLYFLNDDESRVCTFFDFFSEFRSFPGSQKYIIEVNTDDHVTRELDFYFQSKIETIENKEDYFWVREMITKVRTQGGDKVIFEKIKYNVASAIEAEDFCSTRNFNQLMHQIEKALFKPQPNLDTFIEQLENSKGFRAIRAEAFRAQSFLMRMPSMDSAIESSTPLNESTSLQNR